MRKTVFFCDCFKNLIETVHKALKKKVLCLSVFFSFDIE